MRQSESLEQQAFDDNIKVHRCPLDGIDALYITIGTHAKIFIRPTDTQAELACLLAEELGHHMTGTLVLTYASLDDARAEAKARCWGHRRLIPPERILEALHAGMKDEYEVADYLDVTVEFLREAVEDYKCREWSK